MTTEQLAIQIEHCIQAAFADGRCDSQTLRQIVLAPAIDRQSLLVFAFSDWEDFREQPQDDEALGEIANHEWLALVDALLPGAALPNPLPPERRPLAPAPTLRFADADLDAGFQTLRTWLAALMTESLRHLARRQALGTLPNLVGLCACAVSSSGYADLVAFYHADGALPLWPLRETRVGDIDIYTHGTCTSAGVTMFYPESIDDDDAAEDTQEALRQYRFADLDYWSSAKSGGNSSDERLRFRVRGDLHEIGLCHGHTSEEHGGPDHETIERAIAAHFATRSDLHRDWASMPDPLTQTTEYLAWLADYRRLGCDRSAEVVRRHHTNGDAGILHFLDDLPSASPAFFNALSAWVDVLHEQRRFADCVEAIETLEDELRAGHFREELGSLLELGRYDDVLMRAKVKTREARRKRMRLPFVARALVRLGRTDEALAKLADFPEDEQDWRYFLARTEVLSDSDPADALACLQRAFALGLPSEEAAALRKCPPLAAFIDQCAALSFQRQTCSDALMTKHTIQRLAPTAVDAWAMIARTGSDESHWVSAEQTNAELTTVKRVTRDAQGRWFAALALGGFARIDVSDLAKLRLHITRNPSNITDVAVDGRHLYAADYQFGLAVFDLEAPGGPQRIALVSRMGRDRTSRVAVGRGVVALSSGDSIELFDVSDPSTPRRVACLNTLHHHYHSSCEAIAIVGTTLYVAASVTGLLIFDITDPSAPVLRSALGLDEQPPRKERFSAQDLTVLGDVVMLTGTGGRLGFVNVSDPSAPRLLALFGEDEHLSFESVVLLSSDGSGHHLLGIDGTNPVIHRLMVTSDHVQVVSSGGLMKDDGMQERLHYIGGVIPVADGDRLWVLGKYPALVTRRAGGLLTAKSLAKSQTVVASVTARVQAWFTDFVTTHPDAVLGAITVKAIPDYSNLLSLALHPPRSIGEFDVPNPPFSALPPVVFEEPLHTKLPPSHILRDDLLNRLTNQGVRQALDTNARALACDPRLAAVASGRVYVIVDGTAADGGACLVVDIVSAANKPWTPHRRVVSDVRHRSLADQLGDAGAIDTFTRKAQLDPALRADLHAIARTGQRPAVRVVWATRESDLPAALATVLEVLAQGGLGDDIIRELGAYREQPVVAAALRARWATVNAESADDLDQHLEEFTALAIALNHGDAPELDHLVQRLLARNPIEYYLHGSAIDLLNVMPDICHLLPLLRKTVARIDDDTLLPQLSRCLFRAGHREPPPALVARARKQKSGEEYHSTTISTADDGLDQDELCACERLFTAAQLLDRVRELMRVGDQFSSVWPPGTDLEPWPAGWGYVWKAVLDQCGTTASRDDLIALLIRHADAATAHVADRALLLAAFRAASQPLDFATLLRIGTAIQHGGSAFTADEQLRVARTLDRCRIAHAFALANAGQLDAARVLADALLASDEPITLAYFLDARLAWLAADPAAGIARATAHLSVVTHDHAVRGRLLNLIGCALDEQGRVADALPWFEQAAQVHESDPMYLANLAEAHHRLGHRPLALTWAREALRRKVISAICEEIVAAAAADQNEG